MNEKIPKIVVAALVEKDGRVLLTKEILESGKEYWIIPGGGIEFGESLAEGVKREIKEETGLDIEILEFLESKESINLKYDYHTVIFFFHAKPLNDNLSLSKEVLDAKFFTRDAIKNLNLVDSSKWILNKYFINSRK